MRHGADEARDAVSFLVGLTEEKVLLLAMLADAADECMEMSRILDQEDAELISQVGVLRHFLDRIHTLFTSGQIFALDTITSATCKNLHEPLHLRIRGRELRPLGGEGKVTKGMRHQMLEHLRNWVTLFDMVIKTGFLGLDVVYILSVFEAAASVKACQIEATPCESRHCRAV